MTVRSDFARAAAESFPRKATSASNSASVRYCESRVSTWTTETFSAASFWSAVSIS